MPYLETIEGNQKDTAPIEETFLVRYQTSYRVSKDIEFNNVSTDNV